MLTRSHCQLEQDQTYEFEGSKQIWISQPGSGLDKRQATLQLCIKAEGEQTVKPAIIFRGKGNVLSAEKDKYDDDVHVYFQSNAWMDAEVNLEWTEHTLKDGLKDDLNTEKVLFADNVGFQQTQAFHEACREMNHEPFLFWLTLGCVPCLFLTEIDQWYLSFFDFHAKCLFVVDWLRSPTLFYPVSCHDVMV